LEEYSTFCEFLALLVSWRFKGSDLIRVHLSLPLSCREFFMCGRFELHSAFEIIARLFGLTGGLITMPTGYNIAPVRISPLS